MLQRTSKFSVLTCPLPVLDLQATLREKQYLFDSVLDPSLYYESTQLSKSDRKDPTRHTDMTLTYGEIDFCSFADIIHKVKYEYNGLVGGEMFCDLGSGSGKAVFAAALLHNFKRCAGVEILPSLYAFAKQCKEMWIGSIADCHRAEIEFFEGSLFDMSLLDWRNTDFLFANSTCFSQEMMSSLSGLAGKYPQCVLIAG